MKHRRAAANAEDLTNVSIPDAEEIIEQALSDLAFSQDPGLSRALQFLAPSGYQVIVELCSENGRSKRRNASATTWSPEYDELRIYFERADENEQAQGTVRAVQAGSAAYDEDDEDDSQEAMVPSDLDARVKELCTALAEAERRRQCIAPTSKPAAVASESGLSCRRTL